MVFPVNTPLADAAVQELRLRFFDLDVYIRTDAPAYLDLFTQMYGRFAPTIDAAPAAHQIDLVLLTRRCHPEHTPLLLIDGEPWPIRKPALVEGYLYEIMLFAITARVRSHFLIHAGVVARHGQGVVIAGDSFHGKTTLVLALVRRGFHFLSDEMAALVRGAQVVDPFPRSLRIRPGTLALVGATAAAQGAPVWLDKFILDIEQIRAGSLGSRAPIKHLLVLQDPVKASNAACRDEPRTLHLLVDHLEETLLAAVRRLPGVQQAAGRLENGHAALDIALHPGALALTALEALCRERQILILEMHQRSEHRPTFAGPARLEPLATSQAVMELVRRFQGTHKSALLHAALGGSSTRLFMELGATIAGATCHRLAVGPLDEMADLVCDLVMSA